VFKTLSERKSYLKRLMIEKQGVSSGKNSESFYMETDIGIGEEI